MSGQSIAYTFDDIILTPQYSTLRSRTEADTSTKLGDFDLKVPIISANMETITGSRMANSLWHLGGIGAMHRFWSIDKNVEEYLKVKKSYIEINQTQPDCIVSVGVNGDSKERAEALFKAGARYFVVDIAHGHSIMMKEMLTWLKDKWGDEIFVIAGNVATGQATIELCKWGADAIKCGVGGGSVCTTRVVSGHGMPSFSAINDCAYWTRYYNKPLIADGGMRSSGDIVKAIVAGADMVMIGGLLSGTEETPGDVIEDSVYDRTGERISVSKKKIFKGSASYDRGPNIAKEGIETEVPYKGEIKFVINELVAGIRSGMSYSNARTLAQLKKNAKFKIQTMAGYMEGLPHIRKS